MSILLTFKYSFVLYIITKNVSGGQVVYGKALDVMVELLRNTKVEKLLIALLSWFKTISELEDEREVCRRHNMYYFTLLE